MTETPEASRLGHQVVSVLFAEAADTTAFESPMKYPPCACRSPVCPEFRQAEAEPQPGAADVHAELRQRVRRENAFRKFHRLN